MPTTRAPAAKQTRPARAATPAARTPEPAGAAKAAQTAKAASTAKAAKAASAASAAKRGAGTARPPMPAKDAAPTPGSAKPIAAPAPGPAAAVHKPAKVKAKLVRDGFTMPQADFDLIDALKARALRFQRPAKKSELLRAGLHVLTSLDDGLLRQALDALVPLKTGRPRKGD